MTTFRRLVPILVSLSAAASCSTTAPKKVSETPASPVTAKAPLAKAPPAGPFKCTRVMGVAIVHEWFDHGFETIVDDARWEEQAKHGQYLERWRNPDDDVWKEPIVSSCAENADNPDRILFQTVNWTYTTADEWAADLMKIIPLLKQKFSNLRHIELFTLSRSPGNQPCAAEIDPPLAPGKKGQSERRQVLPFVDEANARVAQAFPELVTVAPPIYTPDCSVYLPNSPHWKKEAFPVMAKIHGEAYANRQ